MDRNFNYLFELMDKCFVPTLLKYDKEQLVGAIVKFIKDEDVSSFSDSESRKLIKEIGVSKLKKGLLINLLKVDYFLDIKKIRKIDKFSKNYDKHSVGETELRLLETLLLNNNEMFNKKAIKEALLIISSDGTALINILKSFIHFRYLNNVRKIIDNGILSDNYQKVIDSIINY